MRPSRVHSFTRTTDSPRIWPWTSSSSCAQRLAINATTGQTASIRVENGKTDIR